VKYLNARPLIGAYAGPVIFEHPAVLAEMIWSGELDAGLVPVFEALQHPGYALVDGVGICSDGPVYSVFLAHRVPLESVRSVDLDAASLTSVNLLRVLCAEFFGITPQIGSGVEGADARLLIGNQAIEYRMRTEPGWQILDLGEAWKKWTGLPFVYAVWMLLPGLENPQAVADAFRALKTDGMVRMEEWIQGDTFQTEGFRRQYLGGYIQYGLGAEEKRGLVEFQRLLQKQGAVPAGADPLVFL
jgi:chorismate dehydratase